MKNFIEYESELPTVCGDPAMPRCHKGVCEMNRPTQAMRCVFNDGHGGPCQYNYLESQLYPAQTRRSESENNRSGNENTAK